MRLRYRDRADRTPSQVTVGTYLDFLDTNGTWSDTVERFVRRSCPEKLELFLSERREFVYEDLPDWPPMTEEEFVNTFNTWIDDSDSVHKFGFFAQPLSEAGTLSDSDCEFVHKASESESDGDPDDPNS